MSDALANRLLQWGHARAKRLQLQRKMRAFRCEYVERPDLESGDEGVPLCYRGAGAVDDWCEPCQSRNALYNDFWLLKRSEKEQFYNLCAMVDRLCKPVSADAVDPQATNPGKPSTRVAESSVF